MKFFIYEIISSFILQLSDEQSLKLQICETDMDEMMKDNDIMLIHSKSILNSLEHSIKLIISYLVEHRCHQSQDLQEVN